MSVQVSQAISIQNRGTFHVEDTAFTSGDTNPDREQGGNPYIPHYSEEDTFAFNQVHQMTYQQPRISLKERLFNIDIRIVHALIFSLVAFIFMQPFLENWAYLVSGILFFSYYVMSFVNYQKIANIVQQPRQPIEYPYYPAAEQGAYYHQPEAVAYY